MVFELYQQALLATIYTLTRIGNPVEFTVQQYLTLFEIEVMQHSVSNKMLHSLGVEKWAVSSLQMSIVTELQSAHRNSAARYARFAIDHGVQFVHPDQPGMIPVVATNPPKVIILEMDGGTGGLAYVGVTATGYGDGMPYQYPVTDALAARPTTQIPDDAPGYANFPADSEFGFGNSLDALEASIPTRDRAEDKDPQAHRTSRQILSTSGDTQPTLHPNGTWQ